MRDAYLADDPDDAAVFLEKAIAAGGADDVPEIRTPSRTLARWQEEISNHHRFATQDVCVATRPPLPSMSLDRCY